MKTVSKLTCIAATALLVASAPASAIVASWDFEVDSVFTSSTYYYPNHAAGNRYVTKDTPDGVTSLSWGHPKVANKPSSLVIGNSDATGSVTTYLGTEPPQAGEYVGTTLSLTHNNNVLLRDYNNSHNLTTATLTESVLLTPFGSSISLDPFVFNFEISFIETPNESNCPIGNPPCGDIFVLTSGLMNQTFDYDDGTGLSTYYVNIFPLNGDVLSTLSDKGCKAAGAESGCIGFMTRENKATTISFGFTISTSPLGCDPQDCPPPNIPDDPTVPEPGTLALFGLGLMGLLASRRRLQR